MNELKIIWKGKKHHYFTQLMMQIIKHENNIRKFYADLKKICETGSCMQK